MATTVATGMMGRSPGSSPMSVTASRPLVSATLKSTAPRASMRRAARGHVPARRRCPDVDGRQQRQGHGDVEDPAPGRHEIVDRAAAPDTDRGQRVPELQVLEDERTQHRTDGHAQEGGGADEAERPGAGMTTVEMAGAGCSDGQDGARAGTLDDATEDQHLERLRRHRRRPSRRRRAAATGSSGVAGRSDRRRGRPAAWPRCRPPGRP